MVRNSLPVSDIKIYSSDTPHPHPHHTHIQKYTVVILNIPFFPDAPALFPSFSLSFDFCLVNSAAMRSCGSGSVCTCSRLVRRLRP